MSRGELGGKEVARLLARPGGWARLFWRLFHRNLRLAARAEVALLEHEFMFGKPGGSTPSGIINARAYQ